MNKKKILFVMNNLNCGGAEKALVSLLQEMDFSKYEVDLFLFKHEGMFLKQVPEAVSILPPPELYPYFDMSLKTAVVENLSKGRFNVAWNRLMTGFIYKTEKNPARREQKAWKYLSKTIEKLDKKYDAAIGYLEKMPNYFCVEKVSAPIKIGFIHNDYNKLGMDPKIDLPYFEQLDHIFTISELCEKILVENFPRFEPKFSVMYNISSPETLIKMAGEPIDFVKKGITLVSVGRLNEQKGFDRAILSCKILVDKGYDVYWYVLGEGEERKSLEKIIADNGMQERFMLLGIQENPYPFVKIADIYVQPSRFEGKSIAIDEAKILAKPIVVTDFPSVADQLTHLENGFIVAQNETAIAEGIVELIENVPLREKLIAKLQSEEFDTKAEIEKLYAVIK